MSHNNTELIWGRPWCREDWGVGVCGGGAGEEKSETICDGAVEGKGNINAIRI